MGLAASLSFSALSKADSQIDCSAYELKRALSGCQREAQLLLERRRRERVWASWKRRIFQPCVFVSSQFRDDGFVFVCHMFATERKRRVQYQYSSARILPRAKRKTRLSWKPDCFVEKKRYFVTKYLKILSLITANLKQAILNSECFKFYLVVFFF